MGLRQWSFRGLGVLIACGVLLLVSAAGASAATIVVDTNEDADPSDTADDECSLREAIKRVGGSLDEDCEEDPSDPAADKIVFDDLGAGNHLIEAAEHFILNDPVEIDATTIAGEVRIDGAGADPSFGDHGIQPRADGIVLKGLSITRWGQTGVKIDTNTNGTAPADGVQVIDNFIGTDEAGQSGLGNGSSGVSVGLPLADSTRHPANTVIEGNVISGNGVGINVRGADTDNTTIRGNLIGTNPAGTAALANTTTGIQVGSDAHNVLIGGSAAGDGNVISGNDGQGVLLTAPGGEQTTDVTVQGNAIGLGTNGATLGNATSGVAIVGDVDNAEIRDNTISANGGEGVSIADDPSAGPDDTLIEGNRMGTNPSGTAVRANTGAAVLVGGNGAGPVNTIIGGDTAGGGGACSGLCNVIAGTGVSITQTAGSGTEVLGNHIGVNQPGTGALPVSGVGVTVTHADDVVIGSIDGPNTIGSTGTAGVRMQGDVGGGTIQSNLFGTGSNATGDLGNTNLGIELQGADGVLIGGTTPGEGNLIANNGADGVRVSGLGSTANAIVGNSIHDNDGLGIDLEDTSGFGPTPNDAGDGDTGANGLQNFVDLGLVVRSGSFRLVGDLNSAPNTFFRVEVFTNSTPHPSGFGDGEILTDSFQVETDGSGSESIDRIIPGSLAGGRTASVTVTELDGDGGNPVQTSEFSPPAAHGYCDSTPTSLAIGVILGTAGEDTLTGTAADDILCGLGNNDRLDGGPGDDLLIGGDDDSGLDLVRFASAPGAVAVDLAAGTATGDGADELIGIESIEGTPAADTLAGDGGVNEIISGNGADQIDPRGGPDGINAGPGDDAIVLRDGGADNQIRCGPGNDTVIADALGLDLPVNIFDCETVDRPGPPQLSLAGKKKQKSKTKVVVEAACANEGCTLVAKGTIKIKVLKKKRGKNRAAPAKSKKLKLKTARATAEAGETKKLKLKLPKKAKKLLKKVIRKKTSKATVKATATDGVGNSSGTEKLKIKVKKKRKK